MTQKRLTVDDLPKVEGKSGWPWRSDWRSLPSVEHSDYPLVSIVTPSYNQGEFLEETLRSVLLQGYPNLEYLVIDGGSTDDSLEIIRRYEPWLTYWHSKRDRGQADAINQGIALATGDISGWLNSDDCLKAGSLNRLVGVFLARPELEFLYGDVETIDPSSRVIGLRKGAESSFADMLRTLRIPIPQPGSLWRRSAIDRVGMLDPRWQVVLDREFFLRLGFACKIAYIPETVAQFRSHSTSKSVARRKDWFKEIPIIYQEFFARSDLPPEIRQLERETLSSAHLYCANIARAENALILNYLYLWRAFLQNPQILVDFLRKQLRA